ncbi:5-oxoprolinase subunit PxpA [Robiginitalea sp. SC105]|uniref:5-oxoprolinase subunit PxpA n=1 Tax=Robiginitalea sp. SC105 TaxID=2762332 RepID=UPI00163ACBCD|nr:5-oxoprolinase subunit PxpA [Robiginitalea sp. SC105]MBC2840454.1 5-oxoprolinase subunit PxpA [Robiginitalea sp. SC105]
MKTYNIDLNCDVGEGVGNESSLFPLISSCNIACGGHAGDPDTMREIAALAGQFGIRAGAHPSYPDRAHFGRKSLTLSRAALAETIREQLTLMDEAARDAGVALRHIKAHGALYNDIAGDRELAGAFLEIIRPYKHNRLIYVPAGSLIARMAVEEGFKVWEEGFADRAYNPDGSLVSRSVVGALLTDPEKVCEQVRGMVKNGTVRTLEGTVIPLSPQTICVHGDTPGALEILTYLSLELPKESIQLLS